MIRKMEKDLEDEYANSVKEDVVKFQEECKQKAEERDRKNKQAELNIRKQIEERAQIAQKEAKEQLESEQNDQRSMTQALRDTKECEAQEVLKRQNKLQRIHREEIEEKRRIRSDVKRDGEFEDRAVEIYERAQSRIRKLHRAVAKKQQDEKDARTKFMEEKFGTNLQVLKERQAREEEAFERACEEKRSKEDERQKIKKVRQDMLRAQICEYRESAEHAKAKIADEKKQLKQWEIMQRFKRAEYDKKIELETKNQERQRKLDYAKILQQHKEEQRAELEREKKIEAKCIEEETLLDNSNKKILDYCQEVLAESKNVRPLYPILKAIEGCKKEMYLTSPNRPEKSAQEKEVKRKRRPERRLPCPGPPDKLVELR